MMQSSLNYFIGCNQLLNDLAPIMKAPLCLSFAIPHLKALAADPMFRVRKAVATHMGGICKAIGPEETTIHMVRCCPPSKSYWHLL